MINYEKMRVRKRLWNETHVDKCRLYRMEYYRKNKEKISKWHKQKYKNNRDKLLVQNRKWRKANRVKALFGSGRRRMLAKNLCFDLTLEQWKEITSRSCAYCGGNGVNGNGLDRVNSKVGYRLDNVVSCCKSCNTIKNSILTYEEMKVAMKAVLEYRGKLIT